MLRASAVQPFLAELASRAELTAALLLSSDGRLLASSGPPVGAPSGGAGAGAGAGADRERDVERLVGCVAARALGEYAAVSQARFSRAADVALLFLTFEGGGALAALPLGGGGGEGEGAAAFVLVAYARGGGGDVSLARMRRHLEAARAALAPQLDRLGSLRGPDLGASSSAGVQAAKQEVEEAATGVAL